MRPTGQLYVPAPLIQGASTSPAAPPNFLPSTQISSGDPLLPAPAMVDISLSTTKPVTVNIPGYVAVPQGTINITTTPAATANKDVQIVGGILAAQVILTPDRPATFEFGAINAVVQKTFKIETVTAEFSVQVDSDRAGQQHRHLLRQLLGSATDLVRPANDT